MKMKLTTVLSIVVLMLVAFTGTVQAATFVYSASPDGVSPSQNSSTALSLATNSSGATSGTLTATTPGPTATTGSTLRINATNLVRGTVILDLSRSRLIISNTRPMTVEAVITGFLPDPCHTLQVNVSRSLTSNTINIQVYSLFNPARACIDVLQPFSVTVNLGSFTSGSYTVMVNGMRLGEFSVATNDSVTK